MCHFHCLAGNATIIFSTIQLLSVCEVFISSWSSAVRGFMFTCRVMSLITCIQFRLFIKEQPADSNFALSGRQWSFLSILVKTTWFYCKQLQNDSALNFVQFFLDHSVHSCNRTLANICCWLFIYNMSEMLHDFYARSELVCSLKDINHPVLAAANTDITNDLLKWLCGNISIKVFLLTHCITKIYTVTRFCHQLKAHFFQYCSYCMFVLLITVKHGKFRRWQPTESNTVHVIYCNKIMRMKCCCACFIGTQSRSIWLQNYSQTQKSIAVTIILNHRWACFVNYFSDEK